MINKESLLKKLFAQRNRNYTYTIFFFLIFSFFIIFAIRPSLNTAFSLGKKLDDLKRIDQVYETEILKVIDIQNKLVLVRDDLGLLSESIPKSARVNKILNDLKAISEKNNLDLDTMNIGNVSLKESKSNDNLYTIELNFNLAGRFQDLMNFTKDLNDQRRLKVIKNLTINRLDALSSDSARINITSELEGYYL